MSKHKDKAAMPQQAPQGKLTLVGTPIGNLQDLSPRALAALQEADLVAAEDTRHSGLLLQHFQIKKPLLSYYRETEKRREETLLTALAAGKRVALVSDAGMPGICDPGAAILAKAQAEGFATDAVPGPCALIQALVLSGLPTERFLFDGFLPRGSQLVPYLQTLQGETRTMIFYESPHRVQSSLQALLTVLGPERQAAVCRELTKKFQEVNRGSLAELAALWQERQPQGEFVLVVAGAAAEAEPSTDWAAVDAHLQRLLAGGMKHKAAAKEVAGVYDLPVSQVYQRGLALKGEK